MQTRPEDKGTHVPDVEEMRARFKSCGEAIDALAARLTASADCLTVRARRQLEDLEAQRAALQARFDVFEEAGRDAWDAFRPGIGAALDDLATAVHTLCHEEQPASSPPPNGPPRGGTLQRPAEPSSSVTRRDRTKP